MTTERWFECTVKFINEYIPDAEQKSRVYDHLISELKSNRTTVRPKNFINDYMPETLQDPYGKFLKESGISLSQFEKDTTDIARSLRRKSLLTSKGIQLSVPLEQEGLVDVTSENITVRDTLESYR